MQKIKKMLWGVAAMAFYIAGQSLVTVLYENYQLRKKRTAFCAYMANEGIQQSMADMVADVSPTMQPAMRIIAAALGELVRTDMRFEPALCQFFEKVRTTPGLSEQEYAERYGSLLLPLIYDAVASGQLRRAVDGPALDAALDEGIALVLRDAGYDDGLPADEHAQMRNIWREGLFTGLANQNAVEAAA